MINYQLNESTFEDIHTHLEACDHLFPGTLSSRVNLYEYSQKLFDKSFRFEAWYEHVLVGLIACYLNTDERMVYITSVSVVDDFAGKGIANQLLQNVKDFAVDNNTEKISLEVHNINSRAIALYQKHGFVNSSKDESLNMLKLVYFVPRNEKK
jgi:ribosomal protein S18 acetylase RimI-like enzyme